MRDDHPALPNARNDLRQPAGDILIGKTVETVAANAFVIEALRYRVAICRCAVATMERRIEAGDLRQVREARADGADRRQIVRLVQGRERHEALKLRDNLV